MVVDVPPGGTATAVMNLAAGPLSDRVSAQAAGGGRRSRQIAQNLVGVLAGAHLRIGLEDAAVGIDQVADAPR